MIKKVSNKILMQFHKRFAAGEQYLYIDNMGYIVEESKQFYWQEREVYNKILPFVLAFKSKVLENNEKLLYGKEGLVSLLLPYQKQYNAIKNGDMEFLRRNMLYPILTTEDGSVDIDGLEENGLSPGKILVYRQGAPTPKYLTEDYSGINTIKDIVAIEDHIVKEMNEIYQFFVEKCTK